MNANSLYTIAEIRAIEAKAIGQLGEFELMQRAGKYAAEWVKNRFPQNNGEILIIAGCGNNGGDALVLADELLKSKYVVRVITNSTKEQLPVAAKQAWTNLFSIPNPEFNTLNFETFIHSLHQNSVRSGIRLIVDGLFGIGLRSPIVGIEKSLVHAINDLSERHNIPVLALDTPSGIDVDRGVILSSAKESGAAIKATRTLTFLADKCGLYTGDACDFVGKVRVADLGATTFAKTRSKIMRNTPTPLRKKLKNSHKGSFGTLRIIGGDKGMLGALLLAGRSARYAGAGKIFLCHIDRSPQLDPIFPELMFESIEKEWTEHSTIAAGPGMGQQELALDVMSRIVAHSSTIILDADSLNILAKDERIQKEVNRRKHPTVLTPHPLEAARLLGCTVQDIQQDRFLSAKKLAQKFNAFIVLKGCGTLIATPSGKVCVNTTGNPVLASAGSGDLLTGIIGGLVAQGEEVESAIGLAVWAHGKAADDFIKQSQQNLSYTSQELLPLIRFRLQNFLD